MFKRKKSFFLFLILLFSSALLLSQELVVINGDEVRRFKEPNILLFNGRVFVSMETLENMGITVVYSKENAKGFIINGKSLLAFDVLKGTASIDLIEDYHNVVFPRNGRIYVDLKLMADYLRYRYVKGWAHYLIKGNLPSLISLSYVKDKKLMLNFQKIDDPKRILNVERKSNVIEIRIFPCTIKGKIENRDDLRINSDGLTVIIEIRFDKPTLFNMASLGSRTVILNFTPFPSQYEDYKVIAPGVVWYRKEENFGRFKLRVNYLEIDATKDFEAVPAFSKKGIGSLERLTEMVKEEGGIAGVNGNYFDPLAGFPIGIVVKNGKVLSIPYGGRPMLVETFSGDYYIVSTSAEVNVKLKDRFLLVKAMNNPSKSNCVVYTHEYSKPIPKRENYVYFVVERGKVISRSYVEKAPKDGYVVAVSKDLERYVEDVSIGDESSIYLDLGTFPFAVKNAVEGGPRILEGGKIIEYIEEEKMRYGGGIIVKRAPRTVVATKPPSKLVFMVIDGYQLKSSGLTFEELADFLLKKGYIDAMCLDGGSSSVMVVEGRVVNNPPRGSEPRISVGIVIKKKSWR